MFTIKGEQTDAKVMLDKDQVEQEAYDQIRGMVNHEAFTEPVSIMPDTHWGKGAVIGFTMPLDTDRLRVVPSAIGVDIGCGVVSGQMKTSVDNLQDNEVIDQKIRDSVPLGFKVHDRGVLHIQQDFPWEDIQKTLDSLKQKVSVDFADYQYDPETYFSELCERAGEDQTRAINSVGTLGGGNHFIEIGIDQEESVWCTIHSGSRGIGAKTAQYWMEKATELRNMDSAYKDLPDRLKSYITEQGEFKKDKIRSDFEGKDIQRVFSELGQYRSKQYDRNTDLDYFEEDEAVGYLIDMNFLQWYARINRRSMLDQVANILESDLIHTIDTTHNYIDFEDGILRKGSMPARDGEEGIIPLNMSDGTLVIKGKGNQDWNYSVCHGAGRVMSRTEAEKTIDKETVEKQMDNVYSSNVPLDEAPDAYKKASMIHSAIEPTAEIVNHLKPILNVKA